MASIDTIRRLVELSHRADNVFIATTDRDRVPHMAAAGPLELQAPDQIVVTAWFCPGTIKNLAGNKSISIVVWESANDSGYQIVGKVNRVSASAMLNGYAPGVEGTRVYPQVKQRLFIKVEQVLLFSIAPHGDIEA
jgi:hypothetical protein